MEPGDEHSTGVIASFRRLLNTALAVVHNRVELFGVELREEEQRWLEVLILTVALSMLGTLALTMISLTILYACWEEHRLAVLVGLSVLYSLMTLIGVWRLHHRLKKSAPFSGTIGELKKDMTVLTGRKNEPTATSQAGPNPGK